MQVEVKADGLPLEKLNIGGVKGTLRNVDIAANLRTRAASASLDVIKPHLQVRPPLLPPSSRAPLIHPAMHEFAVRETLSLAACQAVCSSETAVCTHSSPCGVLLGPSQ